jgi:hypothetical protein
MFVPTEPRYTEEEARAAIAASLSWAEALRRLGMCLSGNAWRILKRYATDVWEIPTEHFDPYAGLRGHAFTSPPLDTVLVERSTYSRGSLKRRLLAEGLLDRRCSLCGQDEHWNGRVMALILDHINGVRDDNRLENLRIVCPNCAATLETHCGSSARTLPTSRLCEFCGEAFRPKYRRHRFCSRACGQRFPGTRRNDPHPERRKVDRPPYEQLLAEIEATSYLAVGRRYGVSDNAIRKWLRAYERERAGAAPPGPPPDRA